MFATRGISHALTVPNMSSTPTFNELEECQTKIKIKKIARAFFEIAFAACFATIVLGFTFTVNPIQFVPFGIVLTAKLVTIAVIKNIQHRQLKSLQCQLDNVSEEHKKKLAFETLKNTLCEAKTQQKDIKNMISKINRVLSANYFSFNEELSTINVLPSLVSDPKKLTNYLNTEQLGKLFGAACIKSTPLNPESLAAYSFKPEI